MGINFNQFLFEEHFNNQILVANSCKNQIESKQGSLNFGSRLISWLRKDDPTCLRTVINRAKIIKEAVDKLKEEEAFENFNKIELFRQNLQILNGKAKRHNERLFVRFLSLFSKQFLCETLDNQSLSLENSGGIHCFVFPEKFDYLLSIKILSNVLLERIQGSEDRLSNTRGKDTRTKGMNSPNSKFLNELKGRLNLRKAIILTQDQSIYLANQVQELEIEQRIKKINKRKQREKARDDLQVKIQELQRNIFQSHKVVRTESGMDKNLEKVGEFLRALSQQRNILFRISGSQLNVNAILSKLSNSSIANELFRGYTKEDLASALKLCLLNMNKATRDELVKGQLFNKIPPDEKNAIYVLKGRVKKLNQGTKQAMASFYELLHEVSFFYESYTQNGMSYNSVTSMLRESPSLFLFENPASTIFLIPNFGNTPFIIRNFNKIFESEIG